MADAAHHHQVGVARGGDDLGGYAPADPAEGEADARATGGVGREVVSEAIGKVLYTDYIYFFQAAGLVLLVAMIGAIVLTLRHKPGVKRQVIADQVARTAKTGMRVVTLKPGQGIDQ